MPNVLDLQGLPEGVQGLASKLLSEGACISLLSVGAQTGTAGSALHADAKVAGDFCISLLSVGSQTLSNQGMASAFQAAASTLGGACISLLSVGAR